MERRVVLAVVLMVVVLFAHLWVQETFFSSPRRDEKPAPTQPSTEPTAKTPQAPAGVGAQGPPTAQPTDKPLSRKEIPPAAPGPPPPQTTARVDTPLYRAVVSSEGGKLQEWTLKYRGDKPMVELGEQGPRGLLVGRDESSAEPVAMVLKPEIVTLGSDTETADLVLSGEAHGLRVRETLRFRADTFAVEAHVRLENHGDSPRAVAVALPWVVSLRDKQPPEKFLGQRPTEVTWSTQGRVERVEDLTAVGRHDLQGQWVAIGSKWYLAALVPKGDDFALVAAGDSNRADGKNGQVRVTIAVRATPTVAAGQSWEGRVRAYIGPKEYDRLAAEGLEDTLNFGGFPIPRKYGGLPMEWLGVPILKLMNWLHRFVPNYGAVIILLTVVSKVLFFPLTLKSMRSMKAMQSLQPLVNNLRNKYRSDPRKLQEETLALYRKHNVNPMGGCLPMVAQVPIFYALYLALDVSVELQGAEFLCFGRMFGVSLWVCDLSSHDPTYILPILMGISMFVQQKMTPTMGDPRQAKMMLVLPFVFTFMFLNLPSGLVLYWFVSNVLQILQQWWMERTARTRGAKDVART